MACGSVEGPLLHERAQPDGSTNEDGGATAVPFEPDVSWQYQLTGGLDLSVDVDLFVVDLFDPDAEDLAGLHADGKVAVAYLCNSSRLEQPWQQELRSPFE